MTEPSTGEPRSAGEPRPIKWQGLRVAADWLLVVVALISVGWASVSVPDAAESEFRSEIVLGTEPHASEAIWFIDATNTIRWSNGSAEGSASLAFASTSVPANVLVLVHPESLFEPLAETIRVLQQAGAQRVDVAMSKDDPFSL